MLPKLLRHSKAIIIRAVIIEDMPNARQALQADLDMYYPSIEVVGTADGVVSGAKLVKHTPIDILFLDIQLGDGTGFDLLEILGQVDFKIIFTTASDEYALKAFRFAAVDYLLKPINPDDLVKAIDRAKSQLESSSNRLSLLQEMYQAPDQLPQKMSLHTQEQIEVIRIQDIIRCEADDNNTIFYFVDGGKRYVTKTLKTFEKQLKDHQFLRVHQSHLVNVAQIQSYIRTEGGYLQMKNGDSVPVAVRKKAMVVEVLGGFG